MPRYWFHIIDHDRLVADEIGIELPDDQAAILEAHHGVRDMLADAAANGDDVSHQVMQVETEGGVVTRIPVKAVNRTTH
jgi:hypothetical protein